MTYGIYSIRDVKTGFMTPTLDQNDDSAARNFYHAVATSDGILYTYASDFTLYCLGEFDSETGKITVLDVPDHVADGSQALSVLRKKESSDV